MASFENQLLKDINQHERDVHIKFYEKGHIYYVKKTKRIYFCNDTYS